MKQKRTQPGFTIVELLIVIVVIAILAAITIVAYNGISKRAATSGIQSDLKGAATKLETLKVTSSNNQYPDSFGLTGINFGADSTVSYYKDAGVAFCVSITRNGVPYFILNGGGPQPGLCSGTNLGGQTVFVYNTTLANCATTVQLPITSPTSAAGSTIDWGDGATESLTSSLQSHTYASEGVYTVRYDGPISVVNSNSVAPSNEGCLYAVTQWKDGISPTAVSFAYSISLTNVAEPPRTVTNMNNMFSDTAAFNQPIGNWDTSRVTTMVGMFTNATNFNQPLNSWNTSKVTAMSNMFASAWNFNQPLNSWDTSKVTNISGMFTNATNFNQPLNSWNTSRVISMNAVFGYAYAFNQPLNNWDTSKVNTMSQMFFYASAFNQDLSSWNVGLVTPKPPTNFATGATAWTLPKPTW